MRSAPRLIWFATKKTAELPWGGPAFFSTLLGPGWGTIWLPSLRHTGRSQREPLPKFKTQPKNVTLKNQRFQSRRWYQNFVASSMHVKAEQTNSLIHSSVVCIWLALHFLAEWQTPRYLRKRFTQTLVRLVFDCRMGWMKVEQGRRFKIPARREERSLDFLLVRHISKVT